MEAAGYNPDDFDGWYFNDVVSFFLPTQYDMPSTDYTGLPISSLAGGSIQGVAHMKASSGTDIDPVFVAIAGLTVIVAIAAVWFVSRQN